MLIKNTRHYLLTGLLSILPITLTYWILIKLFHFFSNPGAKIVDILFKNNVPKYFPELSGFLLTILFIYCCGLLVSNVLGNKIYTLIESIVQKIPIVNTVYTTIKQITSTITSPNRDAFKKVVFIEYPRRGVWTLSMVTGESYNKNGDLYLHIFVPTTPNPTSGYLLYIPQDETIETDMTIEEGIKIIISGGILSPKSNELSTSVSKK